MVASFQVTFLGTGTSVGVPVIGCHCPVCTSPDPRNKRTRSSLHVAYGNVSLLVDAGPDLRCQALRENLDRLDAVLYTHAHLDHVAGFDELRAFCWRRDRPLPLHASSGTLGALRRMFDWAFRPENTYPGYVKPLAVPFAGSFSYGDLHVTPVPVKHAELETHGFLLEPVGAPSVAYIPDVKSIPDSSLDLLRGVDHLIIDALRPTSHPTHLSTSEALDLIDFCEAGHGWLTHLGHENEHSTLEKSLPSKVHVACDGLRLFPEIRT